MLAEQHTQLICCRVGEHNNLVNVGIHTCSPITRVLKTILNIIDLGQTFVNHLLPFVYLNYGILYQFQLQIHVQSVFSNVYYLFTILTAIRFQFDIHC